MDSETGGPACAALRADSQPAQITVTRLFDLFVIEREELDYQLRLDTSHIDRAALMDALSNEKLEVTLATLLAGTGGFSSGRCSCGARSGAHAASAA